MSARSSRSRDELLVRPGARYVCSGDGLCCHDIHGLGPVAEPDRRRLAALGWPAATHVVAKRRELVLTASGGCGLLAGGRCSVHAAHGVAAKPSLCRRFPFGATATPLGMRVSTSHRCPCRTLGDRPLLSVDEARAALTGARGRVEGFRVAPERPPLGGSVTVSFATWARAEASLLARLVAGAPAWEAFSTEPTLPRLVGATWQDVAAAAAPRGSVTRHDVALGHFADGILAVLGADPPLRARPWSFAFDAAEARSPEARPAAELIGDFLADRVWDLSWAGQGTFALARATLTALALIGDAIVRRFMQVGARADRAAAEAVTILDIASGTPLWAEVAVQTTPAARVDLTMICDPRERDA